MLRSNVLIPCKPLSEGKSRLSQLLSVRARYELCTLLLRQTLQLARLIADPDRIFLVTADESAAAQARALGVAVIADSANELNAALELGRNRTPHGADGLIVLPIDLPLADEVAIKNALGACDVTLAADNRRSGTNLLALRGEAARHFPFSFGTNSFVRHRESARRAGYSLAEVDDPILAFDLDVPEDYLRASRLGLLKTTELAS
ncbi:MAG TPA: 2-phospho-L-lactate guanylyltransferase [Pseudolabrys sp.]|nr:2-phospho-L-lactate guanylyltransferase [Pseudolabrys sp.]